MPPLLIEAARMPFLTGSLLPVLLVWAWSWRLGGQPQVPLLILTLLGVGLLHLGSNLWNDYFDAGGSDPLNSQVTPFSGGSRVIQDGRLSRGQMLFYAVCCLSAAMACGLVLVLTGRPWVLLVGGVGLGLGIFYSAGNWGLMSCGLGEAAIFLAFGPVLTWGAAYVFTGELSLTGFLWGLPLGFLITAILWINQFPDLEADAAANKRNLVVRLGTVRARFWYAMLMVAPYPSLLLLEAGLGVTPLIYLGLLSSPLALWASARAWRSHDSFEEIVPVQAQTILCHMLTGFLILTGLILALALYGSPAAGGAPLPAVPAGRGTVI